MGGGRAGPLRIAVDHGRAALQVWRLVAGRVGTASRMLAGRRRSGSRCKSVLVDTHRCSVCLFQSPKKILSDVTALQTAASTCAALLARRGRCSVCPHSRAPQRQRLGWSRAPRGTTACCRGAACTTSGSAYGTMGPAGAAPSDRHVPYSGCGGDCCCGGTSCEHAGAATPAINYWWACSSQAARSRCFAATEATATEATDPEATLRIRGDRPAERQ